MYGHRDIHAYWKPLTKGQQVMYVWRGPSRNDCSTDRCAGECVPVEPVFKDHSVDHKKYGVPWRVVSVDRSCYTKLQVVLVQICDLHWQVLWQFLNIPVGSTVYVKLRVWIPASLALFHTVWNIYVLIMVVHVGVLTLMCWQLPIPLRG